MRRFAQQRLALTIGVMAAGIIAAGSLSAATVFDTNLVSPGAGAPGFYNGAGNPQGGFTVTNTGGIELGLRAKLRQDPNVIDTPTDLYTVPTGTQQATIDHGANPARAAWNFEFSIDLGPAGIGLRLSDITSTLVVTDLTGTGGSQSFNTFFGDNAEFGTSGITNQVGADQTKEWGTQNSENPLFFPALFNDINTAHLYQFDLKVFAVNGGGLLASDTIQVQSVTPEPATFGLIGFGLAGLALAARKRLKSL